MPFVAAEAQATLAPASPRALAVAGALVMGMTVAVGGGDGGVGSGEGGVGGVGRGGIVAWLGGWVFVWLFGRCQCRPCS